MDIDLTDKVSAMSLAEENEELKAKLDVAVKCLEDYVEINFLSQNRLPILQERFRQALNKIKGGDT